MYLDITKAGCLAQQMQCCIVALKVKKLIANALKEHLKVNIAPPPFSSGCIIFLNFNILNLFCFRPLNYSHTFSSAKSAASPENQKNYFKSVLMFYFIIRNTYAGGRKAAAPSALFHEGKRGTNCPLW